MLHSHLLACIGFSGFERDTLDAYFRLLLRQPEAAGPLDDRDGPRYAFAASLEEAQCLLVDTEYPGALRQVHDAGRMADTLFIGGRSAPMGASAWLPRPVDAVQVKRALDDLLQQRARRLIAATSTSRWTGRRHQAHASGRARQQALDHPEVRDFHHSVGFSNSVLTEGEARLDAVLVVSDSPAERRVLREWLTRLGYRVRVAASGEAALVAARRRAWGFIFLGIGMEGLDPFQTCRRLKHETVAGQPVIVVLCPRASATDRIRATFAGCDAFLVEPLQEDDLVQLLARHDATFERVFEPTAPLAL